MPHTRVNVRLDSYITLPISCSCAVSNANRQAINQLRKLTFNLLQFCSFRCIDVVLFEDAAAAAELAVKSFAADDSDSNGGCDVMWSREQPLTQHKKQPGEPEVYACIL